MGRPLNKRFFGVNANSNIKVQFNSGAGSIAGYIVKQKGSKKFLCSDAGGTITGICTLVDKASAALLAGEMSMSVQLDDTTVDQVTKITAHRITAGGVSYPWNFSTSAVDGAVQIEEAGTGTAAGTDTTLGTADDTLVGATDLEGDEA